MRRGDEAEWEMGDNGISFFVALEHCPFFAVVQHGFLLGKYLALKKEKDSTGEPFRCLCYSMGRTIWLGLSFEKAKTAVA